MMIDPVFMVIIIGAIALLFLASAAEKLWHLSVFEAVLANYRLLPDWAVPWMAPILALFELGTGMALMLGWWLEVKRPLLCAALLLLCYAVAMSLNILRGRRHIDCGCLGSASSRPGLSWWLVGRNMVLGGLAGICALGGTVDRTVGGADIVSAGGAIVTLAILYLAFEQFVLLQSPVRKVGA